MQGESVGVAALQRAHVQAFIRPADSDLMGCPACTFDQVRRQCALVDVEQILAAGAAQHFLGRADRQAGRAVDDLLNARIGGQLQASVA